MYQMFLERKLKAVHIMVINQTTLASFVLVIIEAKLSQKQSHEDAATAGGKAKRHFD